MQIFSEKKNVVDLQKIKNEYFVQQYYSMLFDLFDIN